MIDAAPVQRTTDSVLLQKATSREAGAVCAQQPHKMSSGHDWGRGEGIVYYII